MPLLNGKPWFPSNPSSQADKGSDAKVYQLRQTGEVFSEYEDYVSRIKMLQARNWTSLTGKSDLNYSQAVAEDHALEQATPQLSKELQESAIRAAHHSLMPLDALAASIHASFVQPSPSTSDKENVPGQNLHAQATADAKHSAVPVESIKCWLVKAMSVKSYGEKALWIAKPSFQQLYDLPQSLPHELNARLEDALLAAKLSEEASAPTEKTKALPKSSPKKRKPEIAVEDGRGSKAEKKAKVEKKPKLDKPAENHKAVENEEAEEPYNPPLRTLEEEEQRLTAGTNKNAIFMALKDAGSDGRTVQEIMDKANSLGLKQYTDHSRKLVNSALTADAAFVRVKKGVYAIRALMGGVPYESIGRPSKKSKPKKADDHQDQAANGGDATATGSKRPSQVDAEPAKKKQKKARLSGEQKPPPPLKTLEEEEAALKQGSNKEAIFKALKSAGSEGLTINGILDAAKEQGLKEFSDEQKNSVFATLTSSASFVRISKGLYALRCLMGDKPYEAVGQPKPSRPAKGAEAKSKLPVKKAQQAEQAAGKAKKGTKDADKPSQHPADGEEVESRTKVETVEHEVRQALETHRKALAKALANEHKAQARITAATSKESKQDEPKTPSKPDPVAALGKRPNFELTSEESAFRGDPSNQAEVSAHEAKIAKLKSEKVQLEKEWNEKTAAAEKGTKSPGLSELQKAQRALKSAQKKVAGSRNAINTAQQAYKEATKAVQREKAKKAVEDKKAEEKKQREEARASEKEKRRLELEKRKAEAMEAKRYPIDDLQLLQELKAKAQSQGQEMPVEDVPLPGAWLSEQDSNATSGSLFVADFIMHFAKDLKMKSQPYQDLLALLETNTTNDTDTLWSLYETLLEKVLEEDESSTEHPWIELLDQATMSDILSQYLSRRQEAAPHIFQSSLGSIAELCKEKGLDELTGQQHQVLLSFLCDEYLDSETMREILQERMEGSGDVKREMREAVAEKKGELREILDAEKEERKKKREEQRAAKKAREEKLASEKAEQEAKANGANGIAEAAKDNTPVLANGVASHHASKQGTPEAEPSKQPPATASPAKQDVKDGEKEPEEEQEPCWELPAELQDLQGDSLDRKALLVFRQKQQSARQKLEKEKEAWQRAAKARAKEREARQKAEQDAERAKEKAKLAAEEEVIRQQEAFERELEKYSIRREPLGEDRHYRKYWFGLASQRSHIYVEDTNGLWSVLGTPQQLDDLIGALDKRGVRELGLHTALEKVYGSVLQGMKKSQAAEKPRPSSATAAADRFPKRERAQAVFFSPSKETARTQDNNSDAGISGLAGQALDGIVDILGNLQKEMSSADVPAPEDGWKTWALAYRNARKDAKTSLQEEGSLDNVHSSLKMCLLEAEELLHEVCKDRYKDKEGKDEDAGGAEKQQKNRGKDERLRVFADTAAREQWRHNTLEGKSLSATAFNAAFLQLRGTKMLEEHERSQKPARAAAKPKAKANPKPQATNGRAPVKGDAKKPSHAKESRATNTRSSKQASIEPPQEMRVTRSRVK